MRRPCRQKFESTPHRKSVGSVILERLLDDEPSFEGVATYSIETNRRLTSAVRKLDLPSILVYIRSSVFLRVLSPNAFRQPSS
jgi:hypothetical protein